MRLYLVLVTVFCCHSALGEVLAGHDCVLGPGVLSIDWERDRRQNIARLDRAEAQARQENTIGWQILLLFEFSFVKAYQRE